MRVDVVFDAAARSARGAEAEAVREVVATARHVAELLRERGHHVVLRPLGDSPTTELGACTAELVFNLVESVRGRSRLEPGFAWLCELAGWAYTGAPASALERCLHKDLARALLREASVPVPEGRTLRSPDDDLGGLTFPLLLKPAAEDASHGIDAGSVVTTESAARVRACELFARFGGKVVAERYVEGRELNVSLLHVDGALRVLPVAEIDFTGFPGGRPHILSYAAKWDETSPEMLGSRSVPALLDAATRECVEAVARSAFEALGLRGYGRVDLRLDAEGQPFVIDVNPNPSLAPDAGFALALARAGISQGEALEHILEEARSRWAPSGSEEPSRSLGAPVALVSLRVEHRDPLLELVRATKAFRDDELAVAAELLDEGLAALRADPLGRDTGPDYRFVVAELDGRAVGYACFGLASLSDGVFDLYWIVVDPSLHGGGIGRTLLGEAERLAREEGGRWLVAETSGTEGYAATRAFYRRAGYRELGRIPEFYRAGDDKVFYGRPLVPG